MKGVGSDERSVGRVRTWCSLEPDGSVSDELEVPCTTGYHCDASPYGNYHTTVMHRNGTLPYTMMHHYMGFTISMMHYHMVVTTK